LFRKRNDEITNEDILLSPRNNNIEEKKDIFEQAPTEMTFEQKFCNLLKIQAEHENNGTEVDDLPGTSQFPMEQIQFEVSPEKWEDNDNNNKIGKLLFIRIIIFNRTNSKREL
jgi:hypothetical protein